MSSAATEALFQRYGARYRWFAAITVMLGTTSMILATTIVNVAIPGIMEAFGISQDQAQWLSTGFLAAMTATMLTTPWCVMRFGQRRTYIIALWLFIAVSLLGGLSWNAEMMIGSRILQGATAGIIQPLAMITIFQVFPVDQRGRAMGVYGIGVVLAPALGPALGGVLVDYFDWRAVFFVTLPLCFLGAILAPFFIVGRNPAEQQRPAFDWGGLMLLSVFLVSLLDALSKGHRLGWLSTEIMLWLAVALFSGSGFVYWELRSRQPLLDLRIFRIRRFTAASMVAFAYGLGLYGSTYLLPLFVQTICGYSPTLSGLLLIPAGLVLGCVIPLAGQLSDRLSCHFIVMVGLSFFALSFWLLMDADSATLFWTLAGWIVIGRIGLGLIIPALNAGAIQALNPEFLQQGSGAINFIRQFGGAFGVNLLAIVLEWRTHVYNSEWLSAAQAGPNRAAMDSIQARTQAFQDGFGLVALVFACALLPAWFMRRKPG